MPNHVNNAELSLHTRKDGLDRFSKALEPIDVSDKNILDASVILTAISFLVAFYYRSSSSINICDG